MAKRKSTITKAQIAKLNKPIKVPKAKAPAKAKAKSSIPKTNWRVKSDSKLHSALYDETRRPFQGSGVSLDKALRGAPKGKRESVFGRRKHPSTGRGGTKKK